MKTLIKNKAITLIVGVVIVGFSASILAAAYKWVDSNNEVHYSQSPPTDVNATQIATPTSTSHATPAATNSGKTEAQRLEEQFKKNEGLLDPVEQAKADEKAKNDAAKKTNCDRAKAHLEDMLLKPRERLTNAQGVTTQLTPEARDADIQKANLVIKENCVGGK
jgi:hypothetical protein